MFEYLEGKIQFGSGDIVIVEIAGVGFKIHVPATVKDKLTQGKVSKVFISLCVREDSLKLFGFLSLSERDLFEKLQTVSGIGPSIALNALSCGSPAEFYEAIMQENLSFFRRIKGIGPKTASRLVLELKGNLPKIEGESGALLPESTMRLDAIKALQGLGYQELEAAEAVRKVFLAEEHPKNLEALLCEALKNIK